MPLAAWVAGHASVGVGGVPVAGGLCSSGILGCPRDSPVEVAILGLRMKILPDLVGADNGVAFGRRFPS
jgi:hypothetical protein